MIDWGGRVRCQRGTFRIRRELALLAPLYVPSPRRVQVLKTPAKHADLAGDNLRGGTLDGKWTWHFMQQRIGSDYAGAFTDPYSADEVWVCSAVDSVHDPVDQQSQAAFP